MKILFRWLLIGVLVFGFVGCSKGGGGDTPPAKTNDSVKNNNLDEVNTSSLVSIEFADKNNSLFVTDSQVANIISHKAFEDNISNGIRVITIDKTLAKDINQDTKVITIPAGSDEYPLGYTAKIVETKENADGSKELKVEEATIRDLGSITIPDQTLDLKNMNFVGMVSPFEQNSSANNKVLGRNNKWVFKEGEFPDFNFDGEKIKLEGKEEATFSYQLTDHLKLELKGEISNLKIKSTNSKYIVSKELLSILPADIDFSQDLELSYDSTFELALVGKGEYIAGAFTKGWEDLEKSSLFGIKIKGMDSTDKKGKIPLAGFVFNTAGVPAPNLDTAIQSAKPLGLIIWVYLDMSGKLTLNGSIGMASHTHDNLTFKKTMEQTIPDIHATVTAQEGKRYLEAPFIDGDVSISLTKGLSVEVDGVVAGIRIFNLGLAVKTTLEEKLVTQDRLSYGVDTPGGDWSWSDGVVCLEGSFGAGAIATATFEAGIGENASVGGKATVQFPSQSAIDETTNGLVGTWYKAQFNKKCYTLASPATNINAHIEKNRVSIAESEVAQLADDNYLYAYLSKRIYDETEAMIDIPVDGWILKALENKKINGFMAGLYKQEGKDNYIIAYGGTTSTTSNITLGKTYDTVIDLVTDVTLFANTLYKPDQAKDALSFVERFNSNNLIAITGHSLGGGLAQYAGLYTGIKTVTFNTAPLPFTTPLARILSLKNLLVNTKETSLEKFYTKGLVSLSDENYDGDMTKVTFKNSDKITNIMTPYDPISTISTALMALDADASPFTFTAKWLMNIKNDLQLDFLIKGEQIYLPTENVGGFFNFSNHSMALIEEQLKKSLTYNVDFTLVQDGNKVLIDSIYASNSNQNLTPYQYKWEVRSSNGNAIPIKWGTDLDQITDLPEGVYIVKVKAFFDNGLWAESEKEIIVESYQNTPPTAKAGADQTTITLGASVTLSATQSSDNETPKSELIYEWSGDNISTSNDENYTIDNLPLGEHIITLKVTDSDDSIGEDNITVRVVEAQSSNLSDGLVAHYKFDGDANDSSGNGNDGVAYGNMGYTDGVIGKAGSFDGVDDYVEIINNDLINSKSFAISTWIAKKNINDVSGMIGLWNTAGQSNNSFLLYNGENDFIDNYTLALMFTDNTLGGLTSNKKITDNNFHHLYIDWDNKVGCSIYVDGINVKSNINPFDGFSNLDTTCGVGKELNFQNIDYTIKLGQWGVVHQGDYFFNGQIDDLRIYNRALNEAEIKELYGMGKPTETVDLTNGLVAHYEFEDNAKDSSSNGNHGTEYGGVGYVDGVIGKAGSFDGVDDYIKTVNSTSIDSITTTLSLSTWVKWRGTAQSSSYIIDKFSNKFNLALNGGDTPNGKPRFVVMNTEGINDSLNSINTNNWHYLTGTYSNNISKLYIDGILVTSKNMTRIVDGDGDITIGCYENCTEEYAFNGQIDDLRIYNRALNEAEIQELYGMGL